MATAEKNGTHEAAQEPKSLEGKLVARIQKIEELLPDQLKGKGDWFVKRALLTFHGSDQLRKCSADSFVTCVIKGAEIGLPIDGKLGHAVSYWNKNKGSMEAQFQPSYMGLAVVAKRSGQIENVSGGVIHKHDNFSHAKLGDTCQLQHTWQVGEDRGEAIGVYAVVKFPNGDWEYDIMDIADVNRIKDRTKSRNKAGEIVGPWVSDFDQMAIKTVIKRALKLHCNDPGFILAVQADEVEYDGELARPHQKAGRSELNDRLGLPAPRQRSQFEMDMERGPSVDERETVDAKATAPQADQAYHHGEPDDAGEQETQSGGDEFSQLLVELDGHLKGSADAKAVEATRGWAKRRLPRTLDEQEIAEIEIRCDESLKRFAKGRKQGSLMDTHENTGN